MLYLTDFPRRSTAARRPAPARPEDATYTPPLALLETADGFQLSLELPGVDPASIELSLVGDELTVRGAKPAGALPEGARWHRRERAAGRFERTFAFQTPVAADGVRAEAKHGVLTVRVAKAASAARRSIPIAVVQ